MPKKLSQKRGANQGNVVRKREPIPLDQPTRRTIETLFRSLLGWSSSRDDSDPLYRKYKELEEQEDELEEKLLDNPRLKRLKKLREAAHSKWYKVDQERKEKAKKLQQQYLANGITKPFLVELNKLIGVKTKSS